MASNIPTHLEDDVLQRTERVLHNAVREGFESLVIALFNKGALINARDERGKTPLHVAIEKANEPMAKLLFQLGADYEIEDLDGQTPYSIMQNEYVCWELASLMRRKRQQRTVQGRHGNLPLRDKMEIFERDLNAIVHRVVNLDPNIPQAIIDQLSALQNDFKDISEQVKDLDSEDSSWRDRLKRTYENNLKNLEYRHRDEIEEIIRQARFLATRQQNLIQNDSQTQQSLNSQPRFDQTVHQPPRPTIRSAFPQINAMRAQSNENRVNRKEDSPIVEQSITEDSLDSNDTRRNRLLETTRYANRGNVVGHTNNRPFNNPNVPIIRPRVIRIAAPRPILQHQGPDYFREVSASFPTDDYLASIRPRDTDTGTLIINLNQEQNNSSPNSMVGLTDEMMTTLESLSVETNTEHQNLIENVLRRSYRIQGSSLEQNRTEIGTTLNLPNPENSNNFASNFPATSRSDGNTIQRQSSLRNSGRRDSFEQRRNEGGHNQERPTSITYNEDRNASPAASSRSDGNTFQRQNSFRNSGRRTASVEQPRNETGHNSTSIISNERSNFPATSRSDGNTFQRQSSLRNSGRRNSFEQRRNEAGHNQEGPTSMSYNEDRNASPAASSRSDGNTFQRQYSFRNSGRRTGWVEQHRNETGHNTVRPTTIISNDVGSNSPDASRSRGKQSGLRNSGRRRGSVDPPRHRNEIGYNPERPPPITSNVSQDDSSSSETSILNQSEDENAPLRRQGSLGHCDRRRGFMDQNKN